MSAKVRKHAAPSRERMYDIVQRPIITEKSTNASEHGQVFFEVPLNATKPEIKAAVEALFSVKVTAVNTSVLKGKTKRFRQFLGKRSDRKKAMVTLEEGSNIDVTTGI